MTKIYLISPEKIDINNDIDDFCRNLTIALKTGFIPVFQLRLKGYPKDFVISSAKIIKKICLEYNVSLIINDDFEIALDIGANGVHLGIEDMQKNNKTYFNRLKNNIISKPKDFIVGVSCYDSRHLAMEAGEMGADYLSFGAFFPSKTKISIGKPNIDIAIWAIEMLNLPIVAIGGIDDKNCKELVRNNIDFIAVISHIWQNSKSVDYAVKSLYEAINSARLK